MAIATVLLTVLGVGVGLILNSQRSGGGSAGPTPVTYDTGAATAPQGPLCRVETQAAARNAGVGGELHRVLVLRTKSSAIWICRASDGELYYHANRGGEKAKWVEGETALFLRGVRQQGDEYLVTAADGTVFAVSTQHLVITHKDRRVEEQPRA